MPEAATVGRISVLRTAEDAITLRAREVLEPDALAAALIEALSTAAGEKSTPVTRAPRRAQLMLSSVADKAEFEG
ncbi:hypothetical protein GCM10027258_40610 [Amycolatopsis stemonae]